MLIYLKKHFFYRDDEASVKCEMSQPNSMYQNVGGQVQLTGGLTRVSHQYIRDQP